MLRLEPGYLKLDRSFSVGIENHTKKQDFVSEISRMIGGMDIRLVAKGIEKDKELGVINELDVPLAQGFFIGRPLPAEVWSAKLKGNNDRMIPMNGKKAYAQALNDKR
jgi:EAL domain-containing protein (putative c-di-GMP-specific phosphodiesterase class I)